MSAVKPAIKDISINLTNAPKELMLGTKQYPLNFAIMNLRNESKTISLEFVSTSMSMDSPKKELNLGPQEKKNVTLTVSPIKDGLIDLSIVINSKRMFRYTESVLEGHENDVAGASESAAGPEAVAVKPAAPVQKPASGPVKPVKPAKPVKPVGAAPPVAEKPSTPVQKPVMASSATPVKPVKPVKPAVSAAPAPALKSAADQQLEARIAEIKEKYMDARSSLQSLVQGSKEYMATYQEAVKWKEEYEKLKAIYESGGTLPQKDPMEELKELMQKYNEMKARLSQLSPGSPEHEKLKQQALAVYKDYTDKHNKAKAQGLIP